MYTDLRFFNGESAPYFAELFKPDIAALPDGVYADYLYASSVLKKIDEQED